MKSSVTVVAFAAVVLLAGLATARTASAQAEPQFGTRAARDQCESVKSQPNQKQIEALIRCAAESKSRGTITLLEDVKVESGGTRAYNQFSDGYATGIDTDAKVLPLRGSLVRYQCNPLTTDADRKRDGAYFIDNHGANCLVVRQPKAEGKCYRTTFGDWTCFLMQAVHPDDYVVKQPPPK